METNAMPCTSPDLRESHLKRVLVAEDERHIARLVQVNLEKQGFDVTLASDGTEAVDLLEHEHFDLAVLDQIMPRKTGYEVLEWIRTHKDTEHMKVVFMTAEAHWWRQRDDLPFRADLYVSKPFSPSELIEQDN